MPCEMLNVRGIVSSVMKAGIAAARSEKSTRVNGAIIRKPTRIRAGAVAWGGTAFNFARSPEAFQIYIDSAEKFRKIADQTGADVLIANHTEFDGSKTKIPALLNRKAGDPNPYVIGHQKVLNYLTIAKECATAAKLSLK